MLILNDYRNNFKHFFTFSNKKEGRENSLILHTHTSIWKGIMLNFRETWHGAWGRGEGITQNRKITIYGGLKKS